MANLSEYEAMVAGAICRRVEEITLIETGIQKLNGAFANAAVVKITRSQAEVLVKYGVQDGDDGWSEGEVYSIFRDVLRNKELELDRKIRRMSVDHFDSDIYEKFDED